MNRNRLILAIVGVALGLAILVLGYFIFDAMSLRTEASDSLKKIQSELQRLSQGAVKPVQASVQALTSNATAVANWKSDAHKLVSAGDRPIEPTTATAFKSFVVSDARRLTLLPGFGGKAITKPDFAFGPFKEYIAEGKMPDAKDLPELQRRWDDVALVVETLSAAGIVELTDVAFKVQEQQQSAAEDKGKRKKPSAKKAKQSAATTQEPVAKSYIFTFTTRAPGMIKAFNALTTCERFVVIDDFSFHRVQDTLAEALRGAEKKNEPQQGGRRRRRGQQVAEVEETQTESAIKNGIVADPLLDAPYTVVMTVTVYDFKTMEPEVKGEEGEK